MCMVYALLDIDVSGRFETPFVTYLYKPYYIGKGSLESRVHWHKNESVRLKSKGHKLSYKNNKILKYLKTHDDIDFVVVDFESEEESYLAEHESIESIGLLNLTNCMSGGIGSSFGKWYYNDLIGNRYHISNDDPIIDKLSLIKEKGTSDKVIMSINEHGDVIPLTKEEYDPEVHIMFHTGRKRTDETRSKISKGKLAYTFTDEHIENMTIANRIIAKRVHLGAKRKDSTKEAISKSRTGEKSKVAKTWKFVDPNGNEYIFKGGFSKFCSMMNLSPQRMRTNKGKIISKATNKGHLNESVLNTEGWWCDHTEDEPNLCFFFIKKSVESRMKCL